MFNDDKIVWIFAEHLNFPRLYLKDGEKEDLDAQVGNQDKHDVPLHGHEHLLEN